MAAEGVYRFYQPIHRQRGVCVTVCEEEERGGGIQNTIARDKNCGSCHFAKTAVITM
jgi:hypothetical protein